MKNLDFGNILLLYFYGNVKDMIFDKLELYFWFLKKTCILSWKFKVHHKMSNFLLKRDLSILSFTCSKCRYQHPYFRQEILEEKHRS